MCDISNTLDIIDDYYAQMDDSGTDGEDETKTYDVPEDIISKEEHKKPFFVIRQSTLYLDSFTHIFIFAYF